MLIENYPIEGSDITPVTEIGEQNHPAAEGDMEGTDELHPNNDTQRIGRMMQGNSSDPIPSRRRIDALKVKGATSLVSGITCNIRLKNLDELKTS